MAEYAGVTPSMGGCALKIMSAYVRPNVPSNPQNIDRIRASCPGLILICGDFNADHTWRGLENSPRRNALMNVLFCADLLVLNDGSATFLHPGATPSVL